MPALKCLIVFDIGDQVGVSGLQRDGGVLEGVALDEGYGDSSGGDTLHDAGVDAREYILPKLGEFRGIHAREVGGCTRRGGRSEDLIQRLNSLRSPADSELEVSE